MSKNVIGENGIEKLTSGTKTRKAASWGLIILLWFVFFPAAIALTAIKVKNEKHNYVSNSKVSKVIGYIFIAMGVIYISAGLTGGLEVEDGGSVVGSVIIVSIIFFGIGVPFVHMGNKYGKLGKRNNRYIELINAGESDLNNMAKIIGISTSEVSKDLKEMIEDGYFKGAYVNDYTKQFVLPSSINSDNVGFGKNVINQTRAVNKAIKCPNCGATCNVVVGAKNECEYCGTPLII